MSESREKPGSGATTQSGEVPRWAADEPTAMWDEDSLRDLGFSADGSGSTGKTGTGGSAPERAPAGERTQGPDAPSTPAPTSAPGPASAPARGPSWPLTIGIACVVAVAVYFLVRLLVA